MSRMPVFKAGEYVRNASTETATYGIVRRVYEVLGRHKTRTTVPAYVIEWADRSVSFTAPTFHWSNHALQAGAASGDKPYPELIGARNTRFDEARRDFDKLAAIMQPGASFKYSDPDDADEGLLVVVQEARPLFVLEDIHRAANRVIVGDYFFDIQTLSGDIWPLRHCQSYCNIPCLVARPIHSDELRPVLLALGLLSPSPAAIVAAPHRQPRTPPTE